MTKKELIEQAGNLMEENCKSCDKRKNVKGYHERSEICRRCPINKKIRSLGKEIEEMEESSDLSGRQLFYLVNHLDVLGLERGLKQVHKHFKKHTQTSLIAEYYQAKKKARHMAV